MGASRTLADPVAALSGGGVPDRPEPGATTNGSGLFRRRRPRRRVVVITADAAAARRYLRRRPGDDAEVHLVTTSLELLAVDGLRLGRRDRVEWLAGWRDGPGGHHLALAAERGAAVGVFRGARHGFGACR